MEALRFILRHFRALYRTMFHLWRRRCVRRRFLVWPITLLTIFACSSLFGHRPHSHQPRLYCILILTDASHMKLLDYQNITWTRHCSAMATIKYRAAPMLNEDASNSRSSYHVYLWNRILQSIRQMISSYQRISDNDSLLIVPAPTHVFLKRLTALSQQLIKDFQTPSIIIHEQQEMNAYLLNGAALERVRNSELIDTCLEKSYKTAQETHLWTCVKYHLRREYHDASCADNQCFVHFDRPTVTLGHIKNGSCSEGQLQQCQSVALLHPTTLSDLITLEFFKYRLKPRSDHQSSL